MTLMLYELSRAGTLEIRMRPACFLQMVGGGCSFSQKASPLMFGLFLGPSSKMVSHSVAESGKILCDKVFKLEEGGQVGSFLLFLRLPEKG